MQKIPLIGKYIGHFALVDDEDYEQLSKFRWSGIKNESRNYARVSTWKEGLSGELMHRLVLGLSKGNGLQVDHRDGNGLNNQRSNLRLCTDSENQANQKRAHKDSTTGLKGVCWNKSAKKYHVSINVDKEKIYLGNYDDKIEAAKAYDAAALKYFGEFAALNFPELNMAGLA